MNTANVALGVAMVSLGTTAYLAAKPVPPRFIRVHDEHKNIVLVNTQKIRWFLPHKGAYYICLSDDGCSMMPRVHDKFIVDPAMEPVSYEALRKAEGDVSTPLLSSPTFPPP